MNRGVLYALAAYGVWGLFPLYWKLLDHVSPVQLIAHRIIWSAVLLVAIITVQRGWSRLSRDARSRRNVAIYGLASLFLTGNWLVYVWAVNSGHIVESSLGYFINPLVSIVLAVLFLGERMRPGQWVAVAIASVGVVWLTVSYGQLPWIALVLAFSFGLYGLLKKKGTLGSAEGLTLETGMMFPLALGYLLFVDSQGTGAFMHGGVLTSVLLVGAGAVTTFPLLLFAAAAQRIPLSWVGILQYITPTLQFLIGVLVYGEDLSLERLVGFAIVWVALAVFGAESGWNHRSTRNGTHSQEPTIV